MVIERAYNPPYIVDLYYPGEQTRLLRERMEQTKGTLTVLVHPFYNEGDRPIYRSNRRLGYAEDRAALLGFHQNEQLPLVILEEANQVNRLLDRMTQEESTSVFVIPTEDTSPLPTRPFDTADHTNKLSSPWQSFAHFLRCAGVLSVILGGENLWAEQTSMAGCVGATGIALFGEGFDIVISTVTSPSYFPSPMYMKLSTYWKDRHRYLLTPSIGSKS